MNLGVRVSGFRAVMRLPSPSEISEETHMHRRMTLERMMLDSFVLTGGFKLPCFRLRAERTRTSIQLCVCVGSRMSKHESPAQMCRTLGICLTFTQLKLNADALWGCLMRRWEKKTRDEMDDRTPFHQSPFRALLFNWTRTIFSGPDSNAWWPLNPSPLPQTIHGSSCPQAQNCLSLASFHRPFHFHLLLPALRPATGQIYISWCRKDPPATHRDKF